MWKWFQTLDAVLRGEVTRPDRLRNGTVEVPAGGFTLLVCLLGASYGLCMGCFAVFNRADPQFMQLLASAMKVPVLFLLTLLVTLPSLYVFNALIGSRLGGSAVLRLLLASLGVTLAVLASLGPIVAFFSLTTTSYSFMKLLNVIVFALSGGLGLRFLMQTLYRLTLADQSSDEASELRQMPEKNVRSVFTCWLVVFCLVGAQMSWVLRPFIGDPERPFEWFRPRESNFFESVRRTVGVLFE